ncbi:hypothetical protein HYT92_00960 [Candidatus Pacearchaeota archaeon]|nr:hypothetical protein [Candidatus Pacearchaeota archaeon]
MALEAELRKKLEEARFSGSAEGYLNMLVDQSYAEVRRYSTEKLASIFYECVNWVGDGPRQETDWYFAERCLDDHLGEAGIRGFARRAIILGAYESLPVYDIKEISGGRVVLPRDDLDVIHHDGTLTWLHYKKQMNTLSDEQLIAHLEKGRNNLSHNVGRFLGRPVWEVYQDARRSPEKFPKGYGEIRFK